MKIGIEIKNIKVKLSTPLTCLFARPCLLIPIKKNYENSPNILLELLSIVLTYPFLLFAYILISLFILKINSSSMIYFYNYNKSHVRNLPFTCWFRVETTIFNK